MCIPWFWESILRVSMHLTNEILVIYKEKRYYSALVGA